MFFLPVIKNDCGLINFKYLPCNLINIAITLSIFDMKALKLALNEIAVLNGWRTDDPIHALSKNKESKPVCWPTLYGWAGVIFLDNPVYNPTLFNST